MDEYIIEQQRIEKALVQVNDKLGRLGVVTVHPKADRANVESKHGFWNNDVSMLNLYEFVNDTRRMARENFHYDVKEGEIRSSMLWTKYANYPIPGPNEPWVYTSDCYGKSLPVRLLPHPIEDSVACCIFCDCFGWDPRVYEERYFHHFY